MTVYLKLLFCIVLIGLWSLWLTNTSDNHNTRKLTAKNIKTTTSTITFTTSSKKADDITQSTNLHKSKENVQLIVQKAELPKPAKIPVVVESQKQEVKKDQTNKSKNETNTPKEKININIIDVASATKKALLTTNNNPGDIRLRNKVPVKKIEPPQNLQFSDENLEESWLPKYILESKHLTQTIQKTTNNLDQIASQLEVAGLINNPQGKSAAIIRNKTNNKIKVLKEGEEYEGLKILQIKNNEVIFGNETLNKRYVKNIVSNAN